MDAGMEGRVTDRLAILSSAPELTRTSKMYVTRGLNLIIWDCMDCNRLFDSLYRD